MRRCRPFFIIYLAFIALAVSKTEAQDFRWARRLGGTKVDTGRGVAVDAGGNVYTVGTVRETVDMDPGAGTCPLTSGTILDDAFVSKLDSAGNCVWARRLGGLSGSVFATGVAVDTTGNVYTVGRFRGEADFDPGPESHPLTSLGLSDAFVSKLDSTGNFVWVRRLGGTQEQQALGVALDASGNVHTVGDFGGTTDFDPVPGTCRLTPTGPNEGPCGTPVFGFTHDAFVVKLDSDTGNCIWARQLGGSDNDTATSVAVDADGNVYTVGGFFGRADFNPDPLAGFCLDSAGLLDAFISKLDSAGNFVLDSCAARVGRGNAGGNESATGVAVGAGGDIYIAGFFSGTVDFDPGPGEHPVTSETHENVFILKLDNGCNFLCAGRLGGTITGDQLQEGPRVALDASGNVHTVGSFQGRADFDPGRDEDGAVYELDAGFYFDAFISKLDSACNFVWAVQLRGVTFSVIGTGVAVDADGNVHTVGRFDGTADFDPGPDVYSLTSAGSDDVFISKIDGCSPGIVGYTLRKRHDSVDPVRGPTTLTWTMIPAVTHYNTYRGTIQSNMMSSRPAPYDHVCHESDDARGDGPTLSTDGTAPPLGSAFYYLVSGENACGEGRLGYSLDMCLTVFDLCSEGTVRPNASPCPTPP